MKKPAMVLVLLLGVRIAAAESIAHTKIAVDEAIKNGVTQQEFEELKPRLLAQLNFKEKIGVSLKSLSMMYQLGACTKGDGGAKIEEEAVRRFLDAKVETRELNDQSWKDIGEFINSVSAMGEGEREPEAFRRPLTHLDRIRAASTSPRIGALAFYAKLRAALIIERITTDNPLESGLRAKMVADIKSAPKDYAEVPVDGKKTFAEVIGPIQNELENLYVGRPVPDTVGLDLAGKPMSLSEYRGKTVLLVGWADWCPDCIKAIPGEKELMQKFSDKAVAFVGINGDEKSETGLKSAAKHGVPGRSFWGRFPGADGKQTILVDQWNIRFWPSYYVIDPKGVIRYKRCWDTEPETLEKIINSVLSDTKGG